MTITNQQESNKSAISKPTHPIDVLSRPRTTKKKSNNHQPSNSNNKKNKPKHTQFNTQAKDERNSEGQVDNDELIDRLLNQTTQLDLASHDQSAAEPTRAGTNESSDNGITRRASASISKKLHELGEDIKEVALAVSSSINSTSTVNNLMHPKRKPHRQRDKIAKRQAAQLQAQLDAQLELTNHPVVDQRQLEADGILKVCESLKLKMVEINPDGHCLFSAIADQLNLKNPKDQAEGSYTYQLCRKIASDYMRSHPDEFKYHLVAQDDQLEEGVMSESDYELHCDQVRDSARWGGEPEILALSKSLKFPIHVVQAYQPVIKFSDEFYELRDRQALTISYHRKSYGLGEHYNSLRPLS